MFRTLFARPLRLRVGGKTVSFATLADFEFCLASRTEVPSGKIADLVVLTLDALKKEARGISRIEKRYVEMLSRSIEAPGTIGGLLAELDPQSVSSDHEWRAIMSSLQRQDSRFDDFKQFALVKYMQYLRARQDVLKSIYYAKKRQPPGPATEIEAEGSGATALRETVIFDAGEPETRFQESDRIETVGGERVRLTDLSSHGTYVEAEDRGA